MRWLTKLLGLGRKANSSKPDIEAASSSKPVESVPGDVFHPHNEIEHLLMDAAGNPENRIAFQRSILSAKMFAATPDAPTVANRRTVTEGEHISLLNVEAPDGKAVPAIFTAQERIVDVFGMGVGFVAMKGEDLLSMIASQGAWLNPGSPYSVYWTAEQLSAVLGKLVEHTVEKDTQIILGAPAETPAALVQDLRDVLASDGRIVEAWLALAHWPERENFSWYLDVRTDIAADEVRDLLAETFKKTDYAGRPLDMVVNKPNEKEGVGIRLVPIQTH